MKHPSRFNPALRRLSTCPIAEQILAGSSRGRAHRGGHISGGMEHNSPVTGRSLKIYTQWKKKSRTEQNKKEQEGKTNNLMMPIQSDRSLTFYFVSAVSCSFLSEIISLPSILPSPGCAAAPTCNLLSWRAAYLETSGVTEQKAPPDKGNRSLGLKKQTLLVVT